MAAVDSMAICRLGFITFFLGERPWPLYFKVFIQMYVILSMNVVNDDFFVLCATVACVVWLALSIECDRYIVRFEL